MMRSIKNARKLQASQEKLRQRISEEEVLAVRSRSIPSTIMYLVLFIAIVLATPLERRFPTQTYILGSFLLLLCGFRLYWALDYRRFFPKYSLIWRRVFLFCLPLSAAVWGFFCAAVTAFFELSWTSFFTLLLTSALSGGTVSVLAPNFYLLKWELSFLLLPSLAANLFLVGGLQGYSLATFFFGFFCLLLIVGKIHNIQHWNAIRDSSKIRAMVDALPGTLSWVSSELKYIGVNKRLADLWGAPPEVFAGKEIGFKEPNSYLVEFTQKLFLNQNPGKVQEFQMNIKGENHTYIVVGQKYNLGTEAVILGIDITEHAKLKNELEMRQAQTYHSAKLATLGEVARHLVDEIEKVEGLQPLSRALRRFTVETSKEIIKPVLVLDLLKDVESLCSESFKKKKIDLRFVQKYSELKINANSNQVFQAILNLVNNAFDITQSLAEKWVEIEVRDSGNEIHISVTDSGKGIPEDLRTRVFEPLFTTKKVGTGTGIGLSVSKELVELNKGRLFLDTQSKNTRFVMAFPKVERA